MAKWGEGDPRWIVEDRPDATNVNNWHWSEKNASTWSQSMLKSLFEGLVLKKPNLGETKFKAPTCTGEAMVNNRKGKLIFFYEWVVKVEFKAELYDADAPAVEGHIEIPNLSEEFEASEINVDVEIKSGGESGQKIKDYLRKEGTLIIQEKIGEYITSLKKEYAQDLILPTNLSIKDEVKSKTILTKPKTNLETVSTNSSTTTSSINTDLQVKDLSLSSTFKCRLPEIYRIFVTPELVRAFTRSDPSPFDVTEGGKFSLFEGNISGIFDKLEENKTIVQRWRFRDWPKDYYSIVTLTFSEEADCSRINLRQTNIPSKDYEKVKTGWHNYYWESIRRTFGFGATLM